MPVKIDADGRRSVQAEVEVPGTPDEVWQAIATGPGISAWFVPTTVEEHVGGKSISHFSPDGSMDSFATITAWDPPHRFAADSPDDMGPGGPAIATEWIVETRSGDTCVVRVVHSWFASDDAWDGQFESFTQGWPAFFRILRLYLARFSGQPAAEFQIMATAPEPKEAAWDKLVTPLGLRDATVGQEVNAPVGAPTLVGEVAWAGQPEWPEDYLLQLDLPAPGIAHFVPHPMEGQIFVTLRFYFYGDQAAQTVAQVEPVWNSWLQEKYAVPA